MSAQLYRVTVEVELWMLADSATDAEHRSDEGAREEIGSDNASAHAVEVTGATRYYLRNGIPWGLGPKAGNAPKVGEIIEAMRDGKYVVDAYYRLRPDDYPELVRLDPPLAFAIEAAPGGYMSTGHGVSVQSETVPGVMLAILNALGAIPVAS